VRRNVCSVKGSRSWNVDAKGFEGRFDDIAGGAVRCCLIRHLHVIVAALYSGATELLFK